METTQSITDFVLQWRANNTYTVNAQGELSEQSLLKLLTDINSKIENMSFVWRKCRYRERAGLGARKASLAQVGTRKVERTNLPGMLPQHCRTNDIRENPA